MLNEPVGSRRLVAGLRETLVESVVIRRHWLNLGGTFFHGGRIGG
jgi:hypothetical protein